MFGEVSILIRSDELDEAAGAGVEITAFFDSRVRMCKNVNKALSIRDSLIIGAHGAHFFLYGCTKLWWREKSKNEF
jgi:hypothetical protein